MAEPVVELVGVSKEYQRGGTGVKAVDSLPPGPSALAVHEKSLLGYERFKNAS